MNDNILKKQKLPWGSAPISLLYSTEISLKAKGLYVYMEAKPDRWNFTASSMSKQLKESRKAILTGMQELKDTGWLSYKKNKNGTGEYVLLGGYEQPESQNRTMASDSQSPVSARCQNGTVSKEDCISKKDLASKKDLISKKDIHTEQAQNPSEIIDSFFPNEKSTEVLRVKCPKISKRQALDMIEQFKDKMNARKAPWDANDIQGQFRTHVRNRWIKPSVIDFTDDKQNKQKGTYANRSEGQNLISIAKLAEKQGIVAWENGKVKQSVIDAFENNELEVLKQA
jgi:hypothetical protein